MMAGLITNMAATWLKVGSRYSVDTLDTGMIHRDDPGWDGLRRHKIASYYSEGVLFKMYELFISGIFHVMFLDCG